MAKTVAIKPEEQFAVHYADRLILEKLTEMESAVKLGELADKLANVGLGLAAVKSLLASDPERFAYHERRWIPASRLEGQGRPVVEAMAIVLHRFGGPISLSLLCAEVSRIRQQELEQASEMVVRIAHRDRAFVVTSDERIALTTWGFRALDEKLPRALDLNGISTAEFDAAATTLEGTDWRSPTAIADALAKVAPISLKSFSAVAFSKLNGTDPRSVLMFDDRSFFAAVLNTPGYVLGADGLIYGEDETRKWITTAVRVADRLSPTVEIEDAAPIEIKPEDVSRLINRILSNEQSTSTARLLEEFYEITPANKTYPDDVANIMSALRPNPQVQWVGGDRFRKAGDLPDFIQEVPEPFHFVQTDVVDEEGELVDVELTDEGLSQTLRKLLQHPLAVDVLDEEILPELKQVPDSVRMVLKSIHRDLGTFPLAQLPTGWLTENPRLQELLFIDPKGRELQVWMNTDARLMYNLIDWWYEQPIENGAVFTLTKTNRRNTFEFEWLDQPDPVVYISNQRMEELRQIAADSEGKSTLDLLIQVMGHWPKGADYLTLLAEVNVVRRSSRRLIASLLSSYQCFYQRSGSPVWHFDAKKVEQGFDKTKKKFIKK